MASRFRRSDPASWHKVEMDELVDLLASRTGLNAREIREALQDLTNTDVYVKTLGLGSYCGLSRGRNRKP